ncbi:MAG: carboxypeptidase-like regulatory domain-containing protein [Acidobacteriota bacterium]|nr:carboxypeptidase-like regulatory domain-containing protein [Acidobacteriota bacterium]
MKLLFFSFMCAVVLSAQSSTRAVEGTVTDSSGKAVSRAVVKLQNPRTLVIRSYYTGRKGKYHFTGLSTYQDYQLRADFKSTSSDWQWLTRFDSGKRAKLDLHLK